MAVLFEPITIKGVEIRNRIWLSPMCTYSVQKLDGVPTEFHLVHYGSFAQGGFGLVMSEANAVCPEGRLNPHDVGLYSDTQIDAWKKITDFVHAQGAKMGVQLNHAGRKGSRGRGFPGESSTTISPADGGWPTVGPSAISREGYATPRELTVEEIQQIVEDFREAARRAKAAGFDVIDIHGAHGFLLNNFLSPLSNHRTDQYGGDFVGRTRLLHEIVSAVQKVWDGPLFVRISATEWCDDGWQLSDSIKLARELKDQGVDLIDVSTGGNVDVKIPLEPGYQVRFAAEIKKQVQILTSAVGLITEPTQAEEILAAGNADAIFVGRVALREPFWPLRAGNELGLPKEQTPYQPQYHRGAWQDVKF